MIRLLDWSIIACYGVRYKREKHISLQILAQIADGLFMVLSEQ